VNYLLDVSALIPLITRRGKQLIVDASLENLATTDLAIYEACNSLWKLSTLLKSISLKDAVDVATTLEDLAMKGVIQPISYTQLDFSNTLSRAHEEMQTFYDASYVAATETSEAILVTEDEKLRKSASKFVKTINYADFESRLAQT